MADETTALPFPGGRQLWVEQSPGIYAMAVSGGGGGGGTTSVQGNVASGATDAGGAVKIGGVATNAAPTSAANGTRVDAWFTPRGALQVAGITVTPTDASANSISQITGTLGGGGNLGIVNHVFNGATWDRQRGDTTGTYVVQRAATTGGTLTARMISAASTNATSVKATAGQIYGIQLSNSGAGWAFVKLYNKATAPTVGTDVPIEIIGIPPGGRCEINRPVGMPFAAGIAMAVTGAFADADTTAVTAGQVVGSIHYA